MESGNTWRDKMFTQWWLDLFRFDSACNFPQFKSEEGALYPHCEHAFPIKHNPTKK